MRDGTEVELSSAWEFRITHVAPLLRASGIHFGAGTTSP